MGAILRTAGSHCEGEKGKGRGRQGGVIEASQGMEGCAMGHAGHHHGIAFTHIQLTCLVETPLMEQLSTAFNCICSRIPSINLL